MITFCNVSLSICCDANITVILKTVRQKKINNKINKQRNSLALTTCETCVTRVTIKNVKNIKYQEHSTRLKNLEVCQK